LAVNKRKILDAARKYVQKGAKQKALKEYERLLKLDPRDGKVRLEIGDAHRRWGQVDDAVTQYLKVAEQYKADGFDARAVAVYKQVLHLDPKRHGAQVALSELYQRMGLDAEAIASLQAAADGYHKEGKRREALELLRRMATLDPSNTTSRLKVADLLRQESMNDEAIAEYEAVAEELRRQDNLESVASVYGRILELAPSRSDILVAAGRTWIQLQKPEKAEAMARRAVEQGPEDTDHLELLCDVLKALGRSDELASTTRELARIYRARGDDERARDAMQRLPDVDGLGLDAEEDAAAADEPRIAEPGEGPSLDGDGLLGDESGTGLGDEEILDDDFLAPDDGFLDGGGGDDDAAAAPAAAEPPAPEPAPAAEEPPPAGDPDQLMAEASVYLRYGKRDRAVASLRGVLAQEPEHRGALEKLGEVYAEQGDGGEAVACWTRAARAAAAEGDAEALGVLRDRVAAVDPGAVEGLPAPAPPPAAEEPAADAEGGVELDLDLDLDLDVEVEGEAADVAGAEPDPVLGDDGPLDFEIEPPGADAEDASAAGDTRGASSGAEDPGIEIDLDVDGADFADGGSDGASAEAAGPDPGGGIAIDLDVDGPDATEDAASAADAAAPGDDGGIEIDLDLDGQEAGDGAAAGAAPEPDPAAVSRAGASTSQQIAEELEEAEFYFEQGMLEEAEGVYRRVLQRAPQHPSALLRLGEITARRGPAPGVAPDPGERDDASQAPADPGDTAAASGPGEEPAGGLDLDPDVEGDGAWGDAPAAEAAPEARPEAAAAPAETPGVLSTPTLEVDAAPAEGEAPPDETQPLASTQPAASSPEPAASPDPGDTFDLAAELRGALEDDEPDPAEQSGSVLSTVEDGFAAIFSEFKKGVSQTLSEGDTDTRYDLGIAYREMGLFEDAIGEFRVCLQDPSRRVDSLNMMGLCALDLGRAQDAVNHFEQALAGEGVDESARAGLHFDLGRALEACGESERARDAYQVTAAFDADYQDVRERLRALEEGESYESFDDLTGEDDASEETFESFDDVLTAAELEDEDAEDATDAEPLDAEPLDPEPEPGPGDDPGSSGSGRRRRKISFV